MKRIITFLILFNFSFMLSQSKIDSLQNALRTSHVDSVKISILRQLFLEYQYKDVDKTEEVVLQSVKISEQSQSLKLKIISYKQYAEFLRSQSSYDSAIKTYIHVIKLAEKTANSEAISEAYIGLGDTYLHKGDFKKSLEYQEKNIALSKKNKDEEGVANSYNNMGNIYNELGEYTKAMEYYTLSSKKYKEIGNARNQAITTANIGMVLRRLEKYSSAAEYFKESDSVFAQIDFQPGRAFVLKNLADLYERTGKINLALSYSEKAISSYKKIGSFDQLGDVYYSMGLLYWKQNKFEDALLYFQKKLETSIKVQDSADLSVTYRAIGDSYGMLKQNEKAKLNYLKALDIATAIDYRLAMMDAYEALSEAYATDKNYKMAFESQKKFRAIKDSLYTKEKRELATEIEAKYQNEQRAKENDLLTKDNDLKALKLKQRVNERNVLIAFVILTLILVLLFYNQFRIKQKANNKLKELDRLKSNFFTNISHEFRTPLTLIKGPIEQLEQNPEERLSSENVKMIRRNANRLLKLVNQLLELSKADEGSLHLESTEGDVFKCLRAVTSSFNSHAAQRNIDYRVSIPQTVLWTSFDRDKLEKIVYNLLSNAFKFSDDASVIGCDVNYRHQNLDIEVSDSGKGISNERLPLIFDRFYQVEQGYTRDSEGSGIGLSIAKAFVDLMDGTITVSSELNKGTYFTIQLPMLEIKTRTQKTEIVKLNEELVISKKPFIFSKTDKRTVPTILIIEDNKDMRYFISEQLIENYKIKEALNGEEGLMAAMANPPDLIITDLMMPKMDGMELCYKLKTNLATSHIPIIMLTAKAGILNKIEGLETGADDYLTKPFNTSELVVRVKNLIQQREKLRTLFVSKNNKIDPKKVTVNSMDQKFLENVLSLLEQKFSETDFGVPQMQDSLAMSKTQLHRKLKAITNEAPGELLRNFRLKKAAHLLSQDADNVTQIAYSVGFNNLSYFAKCFKELYGVSPSSYHN